jgi:6-phosphogluconolactonase (cycloisomerase 2 family)
MESNERMSKRFAWLLGLVVLVLIGLLLACGSNYDPAADGLMVVGSQGSALLETFSFDLNSGHVSEISNSPPDTATETCVLPGLPSSIVMDPVGAYAYAILNSNDLCPGSKTGLMAFKVNSDGSTTAVGNLIPDPNPMVMTMDATGKFLFVAEGLGTTAILNSSKEKTPCVQTTAQFGVCVYAIGAGGTLTAVKGTYTFTNGLGFQTPDIVAVTPSTTVFPKIGLNGVQNAVCSAPQNTPPKSEFLYAVDSQNNVVWEFGVNTSSGALTNPPRKTEVQIFSADQVPMGVAVDPCDRFVYVSDSMSNKVSAYVMCAYVNLETINQQTACPYADGSLVQIPGSPFSLSGPANGPGPIVVDAYGKFVYVVGTLSNTISALQISPVLGTLTALTPPTIATGLQPTSIVVRGDDSWVFVTNFNAATVSQYSIAPQSGVLQSSPVIPTDNYPWGVAVK